MSAETFYQTLFKAYRESTAQKARESDAFFDIAMRAITDMANSEDPELQRRAEGLCNELYRVLVPISAFSTQTPQGMRAS